MRAGATTMPSIHHFNTFGERMPRFWHEFIARHATTFDQTLPWFCEFERHLLEPQQRLKIVALTAADSDEPLAVLPLRSDRIALVGSIHASGLAGLSNYYTSLFAPLCVPGREPEIASALVEAMSQATVVDLNPVASDSSLLAHAEREWALRGYSVERYFRFGNWYLQVGGRSSGQYLQSLPGQLKSTLQRKGKKLRARADVTIRIVTQAAEVPAAMDAYEAVYRSSWKHAEPHADFIRSVATEFAARGWLRLGLIEIGSRPAAAQIWFVYRKTASIFKLAYDEEFAVHSVGSTLTSTLMQHAIDVDGVEVVDYLCGDDSYKRDWMSARRERIGVRAVRRASWPGLVSLASTLAKRARKSASA
jgi:CelD/BcsL family acetyltransferase involved in cellulose biosynthesis